MKIKYIIFLAGFFCLGFANAQSYTLSWDGQPIEDEVTVWDEPTVEELVFYVNVTNNSSDVDSIKVEREFIDLMDGVTHLFCWGACYPPNPDPVFISPLYVVLQPGETSSDYEFSGHYKPNGLEGNSVVKYTFFNMSDESESVSVTVNYNTVLTGNSEFDEDQESITIFPNPVSDKFTVKSGSAIEQLEMYNQVGQLVREFSATNKILDIHVADLEYGIYFVKVYFHDNVITRKLVIE